MTVYNLINSGYGNHMSSDVQVTEQIGNEVVVA